MMNVQPLTDESMSTTRTRDRRAVIALTAIVCVATAFRVYGLNDTWLWFDEVFGATFIQMNPIDLAIASVRFDIHPPAWSYQLWLWSWLGQSDLWLLANSILWSLAAIISLYATAARVFDRRTALVAAAILAVFPIAITHAQLLRMYSMLMTLTVWAWYLTHQMLTSKTSRPSMVPAVAVGLMLSFSHGTGILVNGYVVLYGILMLMSLDIAAERRKQWIKAQTLVAVLSVAALSYGVVKRVAHTSRPGLDDIAATLADYWFGLHWGASSVAKAVALSLLAAVIVRVLWRERGRATLSAMLLAPIFATIVISLLIKPIWHLHALLFSVPFAALAMALILGDLLATRQLRLRVAGGGLLLVILATGTVFSGVALTSTQKQTNYPWAVAEIRKFTSANDVVSAVEHPHFWGVARYLVGPGWGSPLKIQPLEPTNDRWGKVLTAIGKDWRERLRLEPESCRIRHDDLTLVIGENFLTTVESQTPERLVVVREFRDEPCHVADYRIVDNLRRDRLQVILLERESAEPPAVSTTEDPDALDEPVAQEAGSTSLAGTGPSPASQPVADARSDEQP